MEVNIFNLFATHYLLFTIHYFDFSVLLTNFDQVKESDE